MKVGPFLVAALVALFASVEAKNAEQARLDLFDQFLEDVAPKFIHQRPNNENGTDSRFEEFALHDESNEGIGKFTMQEIIARSGYKYENHRVLSDDGYITQITRIINPLVDPSQLKQPPVMLMHGGTIDPTVYVWASAIQHHPEPYPRTESSGPMTSWNRSIAFMLANNGYDVWLIGTRGSDSQNQDHVEYKGPKSIDFSGQTKIELLPQAFLEAQKYWDFSMDEVIEFEIPRQIDKVLELTGARNVSILVISLSSMTVPPMVAKYPEVADKVHNLVVLGPIINNKGANLFIKIAHDIVTILPDQFGSLLISEVAFTKFFRAFILLLSKSRYLRYSLLKAATGLLVGASPKYHTLLEPGVMGHLFMPLSFKYLKHYCQQVKHAKFQKYDHGFLKNELHYGTPWPPAYSISNINVKNWLVISGSNDNLATPKSVQQFIRQINPKPYEHIQLEHFSHLDLVAAMENDIYVNLPTLEFLDRFHLPPLALQPDQAERLHRTRATMAET